MRHTRVTVEVLPYGWKMYECYQIKDASTSADDEDQSVVGALPPALSEMSLVFKHLWSYFILRRNAD